MPWQKGREMGRDTNRTHPWSATAMRNAEGLVQIQVADVRADIARPTQADLGIHVGAVHVDLAAVRMNDPANLDNRFFEDSMRRGISYHQGGELLLVFFGFGLEIRDADISVFFACDRDHFHPSHDRAG